MHIRLKHVTKRYDFNNQTIIKDINCSFESGSFITIMGKSGSGKSTLLRILGGLDLAFEGDAYYDGQSLKTKTTREQENYIAALRRKRIGYVFQNYNLLDNFTIYENLNLVLSLNKVPYRKRRRKIKAALEAVEMLAHKNKYPNQLSGGQQQRIAIARVLLKDLSVIIADEPTGALDEKTSHLILNLFKKFHKQGLSVIIATHSKAVSLAGHRKFLVENGELIEY